MNRAQCQAAAVGARFAEGFALTADTIEAALGDVSLHAARRERALAITAALIGGVALARATAKSHPAFSDEILAAMRHVASLVGGEPPRKAARTKRPRSGAR